LAGCPADVGQNGRFMFWTYYEGVRTGSRAVSQIWLLDPDVVVAFPTSGGRTQLGAFPAKARLPEFRADPVAAIERRVRSLPNAPDLSDATRTSTVMGTTDYPCIKRDPTPRPGLALIGDAAMTSDPVPAVGCGWAFRSAESMAAATTPHLLAREDPAPGLARYRREHRFLEWHDRLIRIDAKKARRANAVQRMVRAAAVHDPDVARRMYLFAIQATPVWGLFHPQLILRAQWTALRQLW
jgi:flavin-dependent dehydrogenase